MIYKGYELKAKFDSGLQLVGQDDEGRLEWIGLSPEFHLADNLQEIYERYGYDHDCSLSTHGFCPNCPDKGEEI